MKLAPIAQVVFAAIAAVMVFSFVSTAKEAERRRACTPLCAMSPHYAAQDRLAPDFELPNLDGKQVKLSDYRGQVVILNFWTKNCAPCLEEMPSLALLAKKMVQQRPDIKILTITTDESAKDAKVTLESVLGEKAPFEVLVDPDSSVVGGKFGTTLYPETWFIDPHGVIRARVDGAREWSNALVVEFAESLLTPMSCPIEFERGRPRGSLAGLCVDVGAG